MEEVVSYRVPAGTKSQLRKIVPDWAGQLREFTETLIKTAWNKLALSRIDRIARKYKPARAGAAARMIREARRRG